jgi:hypothetical protein
MDKTKEGWGWPGNSKKAHYFINGHSLCQKWLFLGVLDQPQETSDKPGPDDCAACHKKLLARRPPDQKSDQKIDGEGPKEPSP